MNKRRVFTDHELNALIMVAMSFGYWIGGGRPLVAVATVPAGWLALTAWDWLCDRVLEPMLPRESGDGVVVFKQ